MSAANTGQPRRAHVVDETLLATVRGLEVDAAHLRRIVRDLTAIGSSPLGLRNPIQVSRR